MFDYSVKFEAIDNISKKLEAISKKVVKVKRKASTLKENIKNIKGRVDLDTRSAETKIQKLTKRIKGIDFFKITAIGSGVLYGVSKQVDIAREYELAFKDVKKAVDGTDAELAKLRQGLKRFKGASFEEMSAVSAEVGKMGFNAKQALPMVETIVKASKALDFSAEETVRQVGKILAMTNQMKTAVKSTQEIMDIATNLENKMAGVKADGILNIWKRNADIYAGLNFDNSQMGAMSGFLEQNFVNSELGATAFKLMINRFISQGGKINKALGKKVDFYGILKKQGVKGLKVIMADIRKMDKATRLKIFGSEAMPLIDKLLNTKNIDKLMKALKDAKTAQGAVEKEWKLFRATYDQSVRDREKAIKNLGDTIGRMLMPVLTQMNNAISWVAEKMEIFTQKHPKLAQVILYTISALSALAVIAGTVAVAMWAMSLPMLAIIGVIALLVTALVALYVYWEDVINYIKPLWEAFSVYMSESFKRGKDNMIAFGTWIKDVFVGFWSGMVDGVSVALGLFVDVMDGVGSFVSDIWSGIKNAVKSAIDYIDGLIETFLGKIQAIIGKVVELKDMASNVIDGAGGTVSDWYHSTLKAVGLEDEPKKPQVVEVRVTADGGAKADARVASGRSVKLKTANNGI